MTDGEAYTEHLEKPPVPWSFTPGTDELESALDSFKTEWDALVAQGQARRNVRRQFNSALAVGSDSLGPQETDRLAGALAELGMLRPGEGTPMADARTDQPPAAVSDRSVVQPLRGGVRLSVPGARLVPTDSVTAMVEAIGHTVEARGIGCVFGQPGVGKTVAAHHALDLLPSQTPAWRAVVAVRPDLPQLRECLLEACGLPTASLARSPQAADGALKETLQQPGVLFLDDAQRLSPPLLDYLRLLWDEPDTAAALVLCGAAAEQAIDNVPAVSSRVLSWHQTAGLEPDQLTETLTEFHDVWADAEPADIAWADSTVAHGNFRTWAKITSHLYALVQRNSRTHVDRTMIEQACARLRTYP
ncbi:ATP-binding protein [Streptomyces sp. NPDC007083]|uniref:ATP-binding protein n=1 Tax=unclassified Streptomyces TaxID=2593676 RepID=UPI0033EE2009